jgi:hypothetical protein
MKNSQNELNDDALKKVSGGQYDPTDSMSKTVVQKIEAIVRDQKAKGKTLEECITSIKNAWSMLEALQKKAGERYLQVGGGYLSDEDVFYYVSQLWHA